MPIQHNRNARIHRHMATVRHVQNVMDTNIELDFDSLRIFKTGPVDKDAAIRQLNKICFEIQNIAISSALDESDRDNLRNMITIFFKQISAPMAESSIRRMMETAFSIGGPIRKEVIPFIRGTINDILG